MTEPKKTGRDLFLQRIKERTGLRASLHCFAEAALRSGKCVHAQSLGVAQFSRESQWEGATQAIGIVFAAFGG